MRSADLPLVALVIGDPPGISPELTAKLLVRDDLRETARIVAIGDRRVLEGGAAAAGLSLAIDEVEDVATAPAPAPGCSALLTGGRLDPAAIQRGIAAREGWRLRAG